MSKTTALSKSKLLAYRQCPKRLWLEVHSPGLSQDSAATQARFAVGDKVGDIAQQLYDPDGVGALIDPHTEGFTAAFQRTADLLESSLPIFEAGFRAEGALAFADVMLPVEESGKAAWRMVEVKSSTSVKDYHRDDVAIQSFVARNSDVPLTEVALAHIDNTWIYPGDGDYLGLLREVDLTQESLQREAEVRGWIAEAQQIVALPEAPNTAMGPQCTNPYACGFLNHCQSQTPSAEHPIAWLPGQLKKDLKQHIEANALTELRDLPDDLLSEKQKRIKTVTVSGEPYFDQQATREALVAHSLPAYFMDFETIDFAVPIWKGTRPYQKIPFQFSVHCLSPTGKLGHDGFLDLSGDEPSSAFAEALISACGDTGPIYVYNEGFEKRVIRELAERLPHLAESLLALNARVVDLLPLARAHYYHPSQQGSWSIKDVLPALCPDLRYDDLDGVQDGAMAMVRFLEALDPTTSDTRKAQIERELEEYCKLDTYAMVRMWAIFSGTELEE